MLSGRSGILPALLVLLTVGAVRAASPEPRVYYKPGCWVELPPSAAGRVEAPGAATVIEAGEAAAHYALPMASPWTVAIGQTELETKAIRPGGWLVAELVRGAGGRLASRQGLEAALPPESQVVPLGDIRRGVPESLDLIVGYDFSESRLQPQERAALLRFVRRGGAVFFLFASRTIPAAPRALWRELFGVKGEGTHQVPGLPREFHVPAGFTVGLDSEMPKLRWQRCGRGIVLAYGVFSEAQLRDRPDAAERVFRRVLDRIRKHRRPVALRAAEPDVLWLFDPRDCPLEWSGGPRRRLATQVVGYAAAAMGLLLSFGAALRRRRWAWVLGLACIAAGGGIVLRALTAEASGLALDTVTMVVREPDAEPMAVVIGRVARLGPGRSPRLRSATRTPPKLVLFSRFDAARKTWVEYRFSPGGASVEPRLDLGQYTFLASIRPLGAAAADTPAGPYVTPPPDADKLITFFEKRWAAEGAEYTYRWTRPPAPPRLFAAGEERRFLQVRRRPVLLVTRAERAPAERPAPPERPAMPPPEFGTVRVAAVQCYSHMGDRAYNRTLLTRLITQAAGQGAKIVVLPECAVHGYMDPGRDRVWRKPGAPAEDGPAVAPVAEPVPGESTAYFGSLAKKLHIYLALPMVERSGADFYNALLLLDPKGTVVAHHRKTALWPPGDSSWATEADGPVQVVESPYGRLGLMICYEIHVLPEQLAKAKADIVLYAIGWVGPNPRNWFASVVPRRYAKRHGFALVAANWSADPGAPGWLGHGYSCVIGKDGRVLAMSKKDRGSRLVLADLPIPPARVFLDTPRWPE